MLQPHHIQYDRQKLYYKWSIILCVIALIGYTGYFEFERYVEGIKIFTNNISLVIRIILVSYFIFLYFIFDKLPAKVYSFLGFFIVVPIGWSVSVISFLTIGYSGITVTGFVFLILASAAVFDFAVKTYAFALFLIISFHFTLLSFYPVFQPEGLYNHIFLLGLSTLLGLVINYLVNTIKKNETDVLNERELLLQEIHHRVKNNLQVISSLLNLQSSSITDTKARNMVKESKSRVKSMAFIHQLLHQTNMLDRVDFSIYLDQLMTYLHNTYANSEVIIERKLSADKIALNIDLAIPLGLISNELLSNAYKYAFENQENGIVELTFSKPDEACFELNISDNGVGLPAEIDIQNIETMGLKLVNLLSRQIHAKFSYEYKHGSVFKLVIPIVEKE